MHENPNIDVIDEDRKTERGKEVNEKYFRGIC